jgi:serine/threonine-protein kinase ULK/ATG1
LLCSSSFEKEKYNVGSPLYMSPEALKKNIYSIKNDIWSIGIIVYELLHGETPWECKTESELIDKMTRVPVRFRESIPVSKETK